MKTSLILLLVLALSPCLLQGQDLDCEKFKTGHFEIPATEKVPKTFLVRNDSMQIEYMEDIDNVGEFYVEWPTPCSYTLTPTKETFANMPGFPNGSTLTIDITETGEDKYTQITSFNFSDFTITGEVIKVDSFDINELLKKRGEKMKKQEANEDKEIEAKLKVAEELKNLMADKKYEEAVALFSEKQQENIKEIQRDEDLYQIWCNAWSFQEGSYERFRTRIKQGNGKFVFENDKWRIDEK